MPPLQNAETNNVPTRKIACKWCKQRFPLSNTIDGMKISGWDLLQDHKNEVHFFEYLNDEINSKDLNWFQEKLTRFTGWLKEREPAASIDEITKFTEVWLRQKLYKNKDLLSLLKKLEELNQHHDNFYVFRNAWAIWDEYDEEAELLETIGESY